MRIPAMVCGVIFLAAPILVASAQDYPNRPIRIVVPTGAGGSADILARVIGQKLYERLGQPVVVESRPGAGQMIGADYVAKSAADGYTIMLATVTYTTSAGYQPKLPFDPVNDLTGITMVADGPFLLVVHPSLPVKTVKELIALARARPGQLDYGSSGTGGIIHFVTEALAASAKINIVHVPYKSFAQAVIDTVGGHVQIIISSVPSVWPQVKANRVRVLAVTTAKRSALISEVPTMAEAGVPGYDERQWWGMFAPGKTPKHLVAKLNDEVQKILVAEEVKSRLVAEGADPVLGMTPEAFSAAVKTEIAKWSKIARDLNLKSK